MDDAGASSGRSEIFAPGLLDGRVALVTGGGTGLGRATALAFDAAYERFLDDLFSEERPELERALRRGFTLRELREASDFVHRHRYLFPLAHPASPGEAP